MESSQVQSGQSTPRQDFFIKDTIEQGDVEVTYCINKEMWSDVLTKPKQGKEFREDRPLLMN